MGGPGSPVVTEGDGLGARELQLTPAGYDKGSGWGPSDRQESVSPWEKGHGRGAGVKSIKAENWVAWR